MFVCVGSACPWFVAGVNKQSPVIDVWSSIGRAIPVVGLQQKKSVLVDRFGIGTLFLVCVVAALRGLQDIVFFNRMRYFCF